MEDRNSSLTRSGEGAPRATWAYASATSCASAPERSPFPYPTPGNAGTRHDGRVDRAALIASNPELAARWARSIEKAAALKDPLGNPMDPGIVSTVAALWLHGIPTSGSCWGHTSRPQTSPWIIITTVEGLEYEPVCAQAVGLVEGFNADRRATPHRRLGTSTMYSGGSDSPTHVRLQPVWALEVSRELRERTPPDLRSGRREMTAFTDFLIRRAATMRSSVAE